MYKGNRLRNLDVDKVERPIDPRLVPKEEGIVDYILVVGIFILLRIVMLVSGVAFFNIPVLDNLLGKLIYYMQIYLHRFFN